MRGRGLVVEQRGVGDRDRAGAGIDGEAPTGVVSQTVADRVGGVWVAGEGRHPDVAAVGGALRDAVDRGIAVGDGADATFIGV